MRYLLFLIFPLFCFSQATITLTDSDIGAFYGAKGFGKNALGGRAQNVYFVTNTSGDNVAGSFRRAVQNVNSNNGGIIIFRTGGTIYLTNNAYITASNVTIAGETAPGGGITIAGSGISASSGGLVEFENGSNIVVRHIRIRLGVENNGSNVDALRFISRSASPMTDIMVDHVSVGWSTDEAIGIGVQSGAGMVQDMTISNSIIGEPFGGNYGTLQGRQSGPVTYYLNYWYAVRDRIPHASDCGADAEVVNNLIYNRLSPLEWTYEGQIDVVGNHFENSTSTQPLSSNTLRYISNATNCPSGNPAAGATWRSDNLEVGNNTGFSIANSAWDTYSNGSKILSSGLSPMSSEFVEATVLENVGALPQNRDAVDNRMLNAFINKVEGRANSENDNGGYPTLSSGTPYLDSDGDGLSDEFETVNGGGISPSTRPVTATLIDGTVIDQSGVTAGIRYTYMDIQNGELAGDWGSGTPTGGGGGASSPDGTKNGTSAMLIAH